MKVTAVDVQLVRSDDGRTWTHVLVSTDEGITGIGEATYSHKERVVAGMVRALAEHVVGRDPFDTEGIHHHLYSDGRAGFRSGGIIFSSAISGIDQALWDIRGKALGAPVCALLGGPRERRIRVYAHFGGDTLEAAIDDARRRLDEGFDAIKSGTVAGIAPGPHVTRAELRRIGTAYDRLRDAVGEDIDLMDDVRALYEPATALEIARLLEPYRLLFLEEPTIPEDLAGYARVRAGTSTRIAGSERLTSKFRFADLFRAGAVDVAQPDIVYVGGITEMKKVAAIAELHQVVIAPHNTKGPVGIMASAHVMAAIPNGLIQEFITPTWIPWRDDVLTEPLGLSAGRLLVPDRPGLGVSFDADALAPHLVSG